MLADIKLKSLEPKDKLYKVTDRGGLYVIMLMSGTVSFRHDYNINGRREALTLGKHGIDGISLAEAREKLHTAKKLLKSSIPPTVDKRYGKNKLQESGTLTVYTDNYMKRVTLTDSTRAMKEAVIERDILPVLGNKLMTKITAAMVCSPCDRIIDRGGNITAVRVREVIDNIYRYANDRGYRFSNPTQDIKASSTTTLTPGLRSLSPRGAGMSFNTLDTIARMPTLRLTLKIIFLTVIHKSKFTLATWDEVDFRTNRWTIPAGHMRGGRTHVIYLSRQVDDLLMGPEMCTGGSPCLLAGRYDTNKPLSDTALNGIIATTIKVTQSRGKALEHLIIHDIRRTASTLLYEVGYPSDRIEKCLAHEQKGVRVIYNKAEYVRPRAYMLQQ